METIFVILVVALAVAHLAWRSFRILRGSGKPGCASGCGGCSSARKPDVVTLELGRSMKDGK